MIRKTLHTCSCRKLDFLQLTSLSPQSRPNTQLYTQLIRSSDLLISLPAIDRLRPHLFIDLICKPIQPARVRTVCLRTGIYTGRLTEREDVRWRAGRGFKKTLKNRRLLITEIDFAKCPYVRRQRNFMNEFLLLVMVIIHPAINPLYRKPKKNYFIAKRRIE